MGQWSNTSSTLLPFPASASLDRGHPLATGLVFAYMGTQEWLHGVAPYTRAASNARLHIPRQNSGAINYAYLNNSAVSSLPGYGASWNQTNTAVSFKSLWDFKSIKNNCTVVVLTGPKQKSGGKQYVFNVQAAANTAAADTPSGIGITTTNAGAGNYIRLEWTREGTTYDYHQSANGIAMGDNFDADGMYAASNLTVTSQWGTVTAAGPRLLSVSRSGATARFYSNGLLVSQQTNGNASNNYWGTTPGPPTINGMSADASMVSGTSDVGWYNGATSMVLVWNRVLTDAEHLAIGQDPLCMLIPSFGLSIPAQPAKWESTITGANGAQVTAGVNNNFSSTQTSDATKIVYDTTNPLTGGGGGGPSAQYIYPKSIVSAEIFGAIQGRVYPVAITSQEVFGVAGASIRWEAGITGATNGTTAVAGVNNNFTSIGTFGTGTSIINDTTKAIPSATSSLRFNYGTAGYSYMEKSLTQAYTNTFMRFYVYFTDMDTAPIFIFARNGATALYSLAVFADGHFVIAGNRDGWFLQNTFTSQFGKFGLNQWYSVEWGILHGDYTMWFRVKDQAGGTTFDRWWDSFLGPIYIPGFGTPPNPNAIGFGPASQASGSGSLWIDGVGISTSPLPLL